MGSNWVLSVSNNAGVICNPVLTPKTNALGEAEKDYNAFHVIEMGASKLYKPIIIFHAQFNRLSFLTV